MVKLGFLIPYSGRIEDRTLEVKVVPWNLEQDLSYLSIGTVFDIFTYIYLDLNLINVCRPSKIILDSARIGRITRAF
ncbi:Uncharacterised protein [uncultured archaeon]|nr:Uncharacterised protein [uncultured archaeon]